MMRRRTRHRQQRRNAKKARTPLMSQRRKRPNAIRDDMEDDVEGATPTGEIL
jgi:hypothetical protein